MRTKGDILDGQHWDNLNYRQRMPSKDWKLLLLNDDDTMIFRGTVVQLVAKNLGYGVVEVSKK